jgi:hypothetical protein
VYRISPENPGKTIAERSAWIDSHVFGFSAAIKAFGLDRFKKNCSKTVNGFNYVLNTMFPHYNPVIIHNREVTSKTQKLKEAAKHATDQVKATYQNLSVKT